MDTEAKTSLESRIAEMLEEEKCTVNDSISILMDVRKLIEQSPVHIARC